MLLDLDNADLLVPSNRRRSADQGRRRLPANSAAGRDAGVPGDAADADASPARRRIAAAATPTPPSTCSPLTDAAVAPRSPGRSRRPTTVDAAVGTAGPETAADGSRR